MSLEREKPWKRWNVWPHTCIYSTFGLHFFFFFSRCQTFYELFDYHVIHKKLFSAQQTFPIGVLYRNLWNYVYICSVANFIAKLLNLCMQLWCTRQRWNNTPNDTASTKRYCHKMLHVKCAINVCICMRLFEVNLL